MEAAEVVELAHKVRLVHRDLKATRVIRVHPDQRETRATLELLGLKAKRAIKVNAAIKVLLALQVKLFIAKVMPVEMAIAMEMEIQVLNL